MYFTLQSGDINHDLPHCMYMYVYMYYNDLPHCMYVYVYMYYKDYGDTKAQHPLDSGQQQLQLIS